MMCRCSVIEGDDMTAVSELTAGELVQIRSRNTEPNRRDLGRACRVEINTGLG